MPDKAIHVLLCFNADFWAPAYAVMRSICLSTRRRSDLNFHLFHKTLTAEQTADLEKIAEEFGATLHWYNIDTLPLFDDIARRARHNERSSAIIYARLMIERVLPQTVKRLVYLDCDTFVRAPIEQLAEADLEGRPVAAVQDYMSVMITKGRDIRGNEDLFDAADPYFNSGVLVIDMSGWRKAKVLDRLDAMIADGTMERLYYDQDFLNIVFRHNWTPLDPMWNVISPRPVHQVLNPKLLHYTGPRRPWHLVSRTGFARIYRHVMTNDLFYRYMRYRIRRRIKGFFGLTRPAQDNRKSQTNA